MFWLPGRVLVVVLLWCDGVSHFFFGVCPQGVGLPVAFTLLLVRLLCLFFFLFFGSPPHTRLRISLIFVFPFRLFCPLWFASCPVLRVFPPGCCLVCASRKRARGMHLVLLFVYVLCCPVCARERLWLASRRLLRECFFWGVVLCKRLWFASHPLFCVCPFRRVVPYDWCGVFLCPSLLCFVGAVPVVAYFLHFFTFFLIVSQSKCVVVYIIVG